MKNSRLFVRLMGAATFLTGLALCPTAQAASLAPGDLIKGPMDAVYYYAVNGKRLVFPTEKTYKTWYTDFSSVKTITSDELATIAMGGNVTYRPGVKLVKVTTDPKVYAVSKGGVLRWVKTEALATALYGADWNTKIDDVPDTYFTNYTVGSPINDTSEYVPATETSTVPDINTDKGLTAPPVTPPVTPPATSTTPAMTLTSSKTTLQAGDMVTLTAISPNDSGVIYTEIFFDGLLLKTCNSFSCSAETQVPFSGVKSSYVAEARAHKITMETLSQTLTLPVQSNGSSMIKIHVGQAQIMPSQLASVIAEIDSSVIVQRIDIYVDGSNIRACVSNIHLCQWADYLQGATSSVHPVYATVLDSIGRKYTSETKYITLSTYDTPSVTIISDKTSATVGQTVELSVTASDSDAISWIEVLKDGSPIKHCDGAAPCTIVTGPWTQAGTNLIFSGRAQDAQSMQGVSDPLIIPVQ